VRLRVAASLLELDIEDHGVGMNAATRRRGLGIVTMRERAALVGGTIEFTRPREGGTLVRVRVPISQVEKTEDAVPILRH
jgi:signal transduction histidine kinase